MQVQHKAAVHVPPHDPAVNVGVATVELLVPVLFFGAGLAFVGFWCFVVYRFFRWFFRVTR
jgi:hypothetical protein